MKTFASNEPSTRPPFSLADAQEQASSVQSELDKTTNQNTGNELELGHIVDSANQNESDHGAQSQASNTRTEREIHDDETDRGIFIELETHYYQFSLV